MARGTIRRFRYLLASAVVLASVVLAGTANWPKG
jgi:outer membrane murein-binding lipoprotein Lpp